MWCGKGKRAVAFPSFGNSSVLRHPNFHICCGSAHLYREAGVSKKQRRGIMYSLNQELPSNPPTGKDPNGIHITWPTLTSHFSPLLNFNQMAWKQILCLHYQIMLTPLAFKLQACCNSWVLRESFQFDFLVFEEQQPARPAQGKADNPFPWGSSNIEEIIPMWHSHSPCTCGWVLNI